MTNDVLTGWWYSKDRRYVHVDYYVTDTGAYNVRITSEDVNGNERNRLIPRATLLKRYLPA